MTKSSALDQRSHLSIHDTTGKVKTWISPLDVIFAMKIWNKQVGEMCARWNFSFGHACAPFTSWNSLIVPVFIGKSAKRPSVTLQVVIRKKKATQDVHQHKCMQAPKRIRNGRFDVGHIYCLLFTSCFIKLSHSLMKFFILLSLFLFPIYGDFWWERVLQPARFKFNFDGISHGIARNKVNGVGDFPFRSAVAHRR